MSTTLFPLREREYDIFCIKTSISIEFLTIAVVMPKTSQSIIPLREKSILEAQMQHIFICYTYWWSNTVQNQKEALLFEGSTVKNPQNFPSEANTLEHNVDEIFSRNSEYITCFIFIYLLIDKSVYWIFFRMITILLK